MQADQETQQRIDGATPNGGVYSVAYWQDKDGQPINKREAVKAEIVEYDSNDQSVFRTYADLKRGRE